MQDVSRILFPKQMATKQGYLIGFNPHGFNLNIIYVDARSDIEQIENTLNQYQIHNLKQYSKGELTVVGKIDYINSYKDKDREKVSRRNIWVNIFTDPDDYELFTINELFIYGYKYKVSSQIIFYDSKIKQQLVGLNADRIKTKIFGNEDPTVEDEFDINFVECTRRIASSNIQINENNSTDQSLNELQVTVRQLNLLPLYMELYLNTPRQLSKNLYQQMFRPSSPFIIYLFKLFIILIHFNKAFYLISSLILKYLPLPHLYNQVQFKLTTINNLVKLSQQIQQKQQQITYSASFKPFFKLYSAYCYLILDTFLGFISILFMYNNVQNILKFVHKYGETVHLNFLKQEIEWLMGFPLGLKTNKNLSKLLGQILYLIIYLWNYYTTIATPYEYILVYLLCLLGISGLSIVLSVSVDLIAILTIHIQYIYFILMYSYHHCIQILFTTFCVFSDQYYNRKTNKVTFYQYEWDQKVVGLLIFVVIFSLLPTLAIYYFWFLIIAIFIFGVKAFLVTVLELINRLSIFKVISYSFSQQMIPKTIQFTPLKFHNQKKSQEQHFLRLQPIGIPRVIMRFDRISTIHLTPISFLSAILTGHSVFDFVSPPDSCSSINSFSLSTLLAHLNVCIDNI